jgi:hypothetical protein
MHILQTNYSQSPVLPLKSLENRTITGNHIQFYASYMADVDGDFQLTLVDALDTLVVLYYYY